MANTIDQSALEAWGVVVIHGVGDTEPGATLGAFLPALRKVRRGLTEIEPPDNRLLVEPMAKLPQRGDSLAPADPENETDQKAATRFPMHMRTFANSTPGQPQRVVFGEVFWADLSRAGEGRLQVLLRTISLVFDLRHLSNAAAAHPDVEGAARLRKVLYAVSWMLCGPIAGLTAAIFAMLSARYLAVKAHELAGQFVSMGPPSAAIKETAMAIFAAAVVALILLWRKKRLVPQDDETWLSFANWMLIGVLVSGLLAAYRLAVDATFPWQSWLGVLLAWNLQIRPPAGAAPGTTMTHLAVLLWLTYAAFTVLAAIVVGTAYAWLRARRNAKKRAAELGLNEGGVPAIDAAFGAGLLQVMLWVIIGTGLGWLALRQFFPSQGVTQTVLTALTLKLVVVAALLICAGIVWCLRRWAVRRNAPLPRLLIHGLIMAVLIWLTLLSVALLAFIFISGSPRLLEWLAPAGTYAGAIVAIMAVIVPLFFRTEAMNTLHIVFDITNHFYRRRLDPSNTEVKPDDFCEQQRIEARARRVLQEMLRQGNVTRLTIVAHSQGTMVAVDLLWLEWVNKLLKNVTVELVTMGSPFTHLYEYYFPHRYPPLFEGGKPNKDWGGLRTTVSAWSNVHRVDDWIGTSVRGGDQFPVNHPNIGSGGHTGYWSDPRAVHVAASHLPG